MKKIVLATAEPSGNYHFSSFDEKHAKGLVHLIPSVGDTQGVSLVPTADDMNIIHDASLVVLVGGPITEWTRHIGFMANESGIPLVFSEMSVIQSEPEQYEIPIIDAYSAVSPYGEFNIKNYFNEDYIDITVTGHPILDNLPIYSPDEKRVLIISSVFKKDAGAELRQAIQVLEKDGYNVIVRPHPREHVESWKDFQVSDEPSLVKDLARCQAMLGVPGTSFTVAGAMGVPSLAIEGSALDTTLPELKYMFRYVNAHEIHNAITSIQPLDDISRNFITGPIGTTEDGKNSADRLVEFWRNHAE